MTLKVCSFIGLSPEDKPMSDHDADFERYENLTLRKGKLQVEIEDVEREMALIRDRLRGGSSTTPKAKDEPKGHLTPTERKVVEFVNSRAETQAADLMEKFTISNALANQRLSDLTKREHIKRKDFGIYGPREKT